MAAFRVLLVLLWLGVVTSSKVAPQPRLIGGRPCRQDERLYHVCLVIKEGEDATICGGSLLRNGWILTSYHCWASGRTIDAHLGCVLGYDVPIRIPLGIFKKPKIYEDGPLFRRRQHDLMLLKLPDRTTIPHGVTAIELPDCSDQTLMDHPMQIAGHGSTYGSVFTNRQPGHTPVLQCGIINKVRCTRLRQQQVAVNSWYSYQYWFCGQTPGVDLCFGDSGGGVEYKGRIYGVDVFVGDSVYPCRKPAAFMDLCHQDHLSWIEKTIGPPPNPRT
ncbi:cationic trypsin-like isoform X1 [Poecilia formosa]|uniref:cationic trypsin-like isoform X1 n=1 Tax=Poecilia formosa TaxID=48698 RepID=UPI0007B868EE|nr:PREDICTED: cationic trypsin-like isoform X1 [Poecilia formosa]